MVLEHLCRLQQSIQHFSYGKQPRLFIELQQNDVEEAEVLEIPNLNPLDESVESRVSYRKTTKEKVDSNIAIAQAKQKKY